MIRTLSIVLDNELNNGPFKSKTLLEMEAEKLDDFIIGNFLDAEQIREKYQTEIDAFLEENKASVEAVTKQTGKKFRGRIIIYEWYVKDNSIYFYEKRIIYKKNLAAFETMITDQQTVLGFSKLLLNQDKNQQFLSKYVCERVKKCNVKYKTHVEEVRKEIKKDKIKYYDCIRLLSKSYEKQREFRKSLKTIEAIYKDSLQTKAIEQTISLLSDQSTDFQEDNEKFVFVNGFKYPREEAMLLGLIETEEEIILPETKRENSNLDDDEEPRPTLVKRKPIESISVDGKDYIVVKNKGLEQLRFDDRHLTRRK